MLRAQNLPAEVFDAKACGCDIDIERIKGQDTAYLASINANRDLMKTTFRTYNNEKALSIIDRFYDSKTAAAQSAAITDITKAIGPKKDNWKENLQNDFRAIVAAVKPAQAALGQYFACQFAQRLHTYYLQYPDEAGNGTAFYSTYAKNIPAPTPSSSSTPSLTTTGGSSPTDNNPAAAAVANAANGTDATPWFWMLLGLGAAIAAAYFFVTRPKDQTMEVHQLKKDLDETKAKELKAREEIAQLKKELEQSQQLVKELKAQLAYVQQSTQQRIPVAQNPISVKNTEHQHTPTQSAAPLRRYLYAPSMDGVFTSNSIKTQPDPDAFYTLEMPTEDSAHAVLRLILDAAVLRRAEAMAQQYLLTACDLKGAGRLPQDLTQLKMEAGEVRREGQGWRVSKKIVLTW